MPLACRITHLARRLLDVLLVALVLFALGIVVLARVVPTLTGGGTCVVGGARWSRGSQRRRRRRSSDRHRPTCHG